MLATATVILTRVLGAGIDVLKVLKLVLIHVLKLLLKLLLKLQKNTRRGYEPTAPILSVVAQY